MERVYCSPHHERYERFVLAEGLFAIKKSRSLKTKCIAENNSTRVRKGDRKSDRTFALKLSSL